MKKKCFYMTAKCLLLLGTKSKLLENRMKINIYMKVIEIINNYVIWN